jgi:hypothetical protein
MEQELLQEQEGTKSEVLGENNTDSYINDMIERKLTERFNRMETEWELKLNQVTEEAAVSNNLKKSRESLADGKKSESTGRGLIQSNQRSNGHPQFSGGETYTGTGPHRRGG